ncbi:hypothetical protein DRQ33_07695 [bacterium]|nr:MAG: hypothetical protein DRQ33_07695 [bacterium]
MSTKKIVTIIIVVVVALAIISAGVTYVIYRAAKKHVVGKMDEVKQELTKNLIPAREKLLQLCPENYDTTRLANAFDEYIGAIQADRLRMQTMQEELLPYLVAVIQDGKFTAQEADSLAILFEKSVRK